MSDENLDRLTDDNLRRILSAAEGAILSPSDLDASDEFREEANADIVEMMVTELLDRRAKDEARAVEPQVAHNAGMAENQRQMADKMRVAELVVSAAETVLWKFGDEYEGRLEELQTAVNAWRDGR